VIAVVRRAAGGEPVRRYLATHELLGSGINGEVRLGAGDMTHAVALRAAAWDKGGEADA
jgi:hypothetical protein